MAAELSGAAATAEPNEEYEQHVFQLARAHADTDTRLKEQIADLERERTNANTSYETLEHEWGLYTRAVYGEERALSVHMDHPITHEPAVFYLRQDEVITVHIDDWVHPDTRREMPGLRRFATPEQISALCNKPKVSSARWRAAMENGEITEDVAAQVMEFKTKAGYITFAKPDAGP